MIIQSFKTWQVRNTFKDKTPLKLMAGHYPGKDVVSKSKIM